MARIDLKTSQIGSFGTGDLQLQNGDAMDATLRFVTDAANTASPLKLSTALVQTTSTLKITTSDVAYIDAEDNSGNNRFTVSRAVASQLVTVDFASVPSSLTTPVGAIRTATDGVNLANVMTFLENGLVGMGTDTPTAKLQVKGDGTNPVARFESSAGANGWTINSTSLDFLPIVTNVNSLGGASNRINTIYANSMLGGASNNFSINLISGGYSGTFQISQNYDYSGQKGTWMFNQATYGTQVNASTSGIGSHIYGSYTFKPSATSTASPRALWLEYDLNRNGQTVSGTATGIMVTSTETDTTGMTHNLMDLQVGAVSKAKINSLGLLTLANSLVVGSSSAHYIQLGVGFVQRSSTNGIVTFLNNTETGFTSINLGGNTSSFPSIKRNTTAIDFRLADDSGYCNITAQESGANVGFFAPNSTELRGTYLRARSSTFIGFADSTQGIVIDSSATTPSASAILQTNSTTKGFLPPRMTTAQKNAITSPATGLVVFDTDLAKLCVFSVTWQTITSV